MDFEHILLNNLPNTCIAVTVKTAKWPTQTSIFVNVGTSLHYCRSKKALSIYSMGKVPSRRVHGALIIVLRRINVVANSDSSAINS